MEIWTDSLIETDRAIRRPIKSWARDLIRDLDRVQGRCKNDGERDTAISVASNNYALMLYLLGEPALAEQACERQIRFATRHLPATSLQPHINLIRLYRGIGRYEAAQRLLDELLAKRDEVSGADAVPDIQSGSEFVEDIYLNESFLLTLKVQGPEALADLLARIESMFPRLGETVSFAERVVMAGVLRDDEAMIKDGLSRASWQASPRHNLIRSIYVCHWLAGQGDPQQAVRLLQRMAGLGMAAYQWRDHAILRMLERLIALARFVGEHGLAYQLNDIRSQAAGRIGDVHASVVAAYQRKDQQVRAPHVWKAIASRSGYKFMPGLPGFEVRKRTRAENRRLMRDLDARIRACYQSYESPKAMVAEMSVA
ncbi:hypothetical protein KCV01_g7819, partial [Aureobasidium melanogenum]